MLRLFIRISALAAVLLTTAWMCGQQVTVSVYGTGLYNPRGLKFGPDGLLYVAEAGRGGTMNTTPSECEQVPAPIGPYKAGYTARISKFDEHGNRITVAEGLPSSVNAVGDVLGVADLAFIDEKLFGLIAGAGCSHGLPETANGIIRVHPDGTWTQIADLSAFQKANPTANLAPSKDDFEPDGTWYSMIAVHGYLYATEPNHQEIDRVSPRTGRIRRVLDVSPDSAEWIGPTALGYHRDLFFGNLGPFPIVTGSEKVFRIIGDQLEVQASELTTVLGLAFDKKGTLYVLESMTSPGFPSPAEIGAGKIVRIDRSGKSETVVTGLTFPSAMAIGPDGNLYVSNMGFGVPPIGLGQILRITVPHSNDDAEE